MKKGKYEYRIADINAHSINLKNEITVYNNFKNDGGKVIKESENYLNNLDKEINNSNQIFNNARKDVRKSLARNIASREHENEYHN